MDAKLKSSFWSDSRIEELPSEQKLALLWLITNSGRDICGFVRVTPRRFLFETGLDYHHLETACQALPTSFEALGKGLFFIVHFLRHQFGKGGTLKPGNLVLVSVVRHAESLPEALAKAFFHHYPELLKSSPEIALKCAALPSPCQGEREDKEKQQHREENSFSDSSPREIPADDLPLIENIANAFPRKILPIDTRLAIGRAIGRARAQGLEPAVILANVRAIDAAIDGWTAAEKTRFRPNPVEFFDRDRWLEPAEEWLSKHVPSDAKGRPLQPRPPGAQDTGGRRRLQRPPV